jgi:undecaprenyl diphosphate synthase
VENGIRVNVIGRRDRLSADLVRTIEQTERATARGRRLVLRLAVDYSAREAIVRAAQRSALGPHADDGGRDAFAEHLEQAMHALPGGASVDLLIRTGGERRLSDFLLWECAYAELVFVDSYWPDYDEQAFAAALREFNRRDRRFGGLHARSPARRLGQAR